MVKWYKRMALADVLHQDRLHIRIWREDGVYVAKCLDIPGCVSQGETRDEAVANIHEAIAMCLDVIQEDAQPEILDPQVEVIERPIEEFLRA